MNVNYKRDLNHNYMILPSEEEIKGYEIKMLTENHIAGFLPISIRHIDGESMIYYEISSKQSMKRIFQHTEMGYDDLYTLLFQFHKILRLAEEYLMNADCILMDPEYIYMNIESRQIFVCYYPELSMNVKEAFQQFAEYMLERVNHEDQRAVMLAYKIYKNTRNTNFTLEEILDLSASVGGETNPQEEKKKSLAEEEWSSSFKRTSKEVEDDWDYSGIKSREGYEKEKDARRNKPEDTGKFIKSEKGKDGNKKNGNKKNGNRKDENRKEENGKSGKLWHRVLLFSFLATTSMIYLKAVNLLPAGITYNQYLILLGSGVMSMIGCIIKLIIEQAKKKLEKEDEKRDEKYEEKNKYEEFGEMEDKESKDKELNYKKSNYFMRETVEGDNAEEYQKKYQEEYSKDYQKEYQGKCQKEYQKEYQGKCQKEYQKEYQEEKQEDSIKIYEFLTGQENSENMVAEESAYTVGHRFSSNSLVTEPEYLGNTMLLGSYAVEEERKLSGMLKGKPVLHSLADLPITIGKKEDYVDIAVPDTSVSRMHARFFEKDGKVYLEDLNSTNGTYKNHVRLEANETIEVEPNDEIAFGKIVFTYH